MGKIIFINIAIFLTLILTACKPAAVENTPYPRVDIPGSEVRQLHSSLTGRDYDLYIRLPNDYEKNPKIKSPVLYLLDGQWDFKMVESIYGCLEYDGFVPDMIIVGISYSGENANYEALRAMDYTPVQESTIPGSGDASKFHTFMKDQLIPFIEENYRANPNLRYLMGSSYGGTFTLFALFTEPALFTGYVAASPVTVYGNRFAFEQEESYASEHADLPARLYLAVGELESLRTPVEMYMDVLEERDYANFKLETRVIEGEGHSSTKPEAYTRGLRFVFE